MGAAATVHQWKRGYGREDARRLRGMKIGGQEGRGTGGKTVVLTTKLGLKTKKSQENNPKSNFCWKKKRKKNKKNKYKQKYKILFIFFKVYLPVPGRLWQQGS